MNRDATIVQVAILLIIVAIVGVAVLQQQNKNKQDPTPQQQIALVQEAEQNAVTGTTTVTSGATIVTPQPVVNPVAKISSDNLNLVKQYFRYIAEKNYAGACSVLSADKCNATKPGAIVNFRREFEKFVDGYEYLNIKDYGFVAPSGKNVVCVKYTYRYKEDPQPGEVSEIMSFYVNDFDGVLKITDRVCEKKYKEGRGVRNCPIQANAEFCEEWIK